MTSNTYFRGLGVPAAAALVLGLAAPAHADSATDRDGQHTSGVSGAKGKTHEHQHRAANFAVKGVTFTEAGGDVPCRFRVIYDKLHPDELRLDNHDFPEHGCKKSNGSTKVVRFHKRDEFVRGMQVCLNGKGDRIKGIKIFGTRLMDGHKLVPISQTYKEARTNCKTWKDPAQCGKTEIAVGLKVHYSSSDGYRGIQLICRPLQPIRR